MKRFALIGLSLAVAASITNVSAQDDDALAETKAKLEQARMEVAEAAQELARLQRELVEATGESISESWSWTTSDGNSEEDSHRFDFDFELNAEDGEHARALFANFPPRLGVVLGADSGQSNRIIGITPGSGAAEAGLKNDDRLLEIDGQDVSENTSARVQNILKDFESGDTVDVLVQRGDSNELIMPVTLSSALSNVHVFSNQIETMDILGDDGQRNIIRIINAPEGFNMPTPPTPPMPPLSGLLTGLGGDTDLISNHEGLANYFGTADGVLILRIADDNSMNLMSGDVILSIGDETVGRPVDVGRALLNQEPGSDVTVTVIREGRETSVYGTIPSSTFRPIERDRGLGRLLRFGTPAAPQPPAAPGSRL